LASGESSAGGSARELIELAREIRERVRASHPTQGADGLVLPDLLPVLHARDAAEGKVASIGTVNPRPPGALNSLIQAAKRLAARLLDWHVREQVEFNRAALDALNAILEALNENNRALAVLSRWAAEGRDGTKALHAIGELRASFEQRAARREADCRSALERSTSGIQRRFWSDLERLRLEVDRLIHEELRLIRQRAARLPVESGPPVRTGASGHPVVDAGCFASRFRGSEEEVRRRFEFYVPFFQGLSQVLDLGCGRGEFLELMREAGVGARGVDADADCVEVCRSRGLDAEQGDVLERLRSAAEGSLNGIFCSHLVEHLPAGQLPEFVRLCASRLSKGGILALESPNPECLATLAKSFYNDPSHQRPVPPSLLKFHMEECGFGGIQVFPLSPAVEAYPSLALLPESFREEFFGGMDYAVLGRKL